MFTRPIEKVSQTPRLAKESTQALVTHVEPVGHVGEQERQDAEEQGREGHEGGEEGAEAALLQGDAGGVDRREEGVFGGHRAFSPSGLPMIPCGRMSRKMIRATKISR